MRRVYLFVLAVLFPLAVVGLLATRRAEPTAPTVDDFAAQLERLAAGLNAELAAHGAKWAGTPPADCRALEELLGSREWAVRRGGQDRERLTFAGGAVTQAGTTVGAYRVAVVRDQPCLFVRATDTPGALAAAVPAGIEVQFWTDVFAERGGDRARVELNGRGVGTTLVLEARPADGR